MSNKRYSQIALLVAVILVVTGSLYLFGLPESGTDLFEHAQLSKNQLNNSTPEHSESNALHVARSAQAQRAAHDSQVPKALLSQERLVSRISAPLAQAINTAKKPQPTLEIVIPNDWPNELDARTWLTRPAIKWYPAMAELYQSGQLKAFTAAVGEFRKRNPSDPIDPFVESLKKRTPPN